MAFPKRSLREWKEKPWTSFRIPLLRRDARDLRLLLVMAARTLGSMGTRVILNTFSWKLILFLFLNVPKPCLMILLLSVTNDYVSAVRKLACDILELVADGLWMENKSIFSKLISNSQNDSCLRVNHYPPFIAPNNNYNHNDNDDEELNNHWDPSSELVEEGLHISPLIPAVGSKSRVGFGEHTDPQILTILRSNDVSGLQICSHDGFWIPVPPDPNEFFVFVGDSFQALTNGRFTSVRHRVVAINSWKSRMSMMYFAAPPLDAWITAPPQINNSISSNIYRPFTWGNFKQIVYSLRLADSRLDYFTNHAQ
ncbi:gibberellin 2-beta-dioxygenase 2 isoform X1 [Capsicum annuum]|uniref:gibberellin 2-beta-dioxygenase 2 isoform X1 n=1 Tax=Capsicum annuum TaxID=4072 RepID=UPI001FB14EEB|nr:gibberellin 2-beta-dioxygenase 2 isoform X1 [Capsicum annuum]